MVNYPGIFDDAQRISKKYLTRDPFEVIASTPNMVFKESREYDLDGLKGYAAIFVRTKFIVVNDFLVPEEKRVVAAHELGHIIRHEARLMAHPMRDFSVYEATGRLEHEANIFAADFLLDDEEVWDEIHSSGADFFSVAQNLRVPSPFFAFKLFSMMERGYQVRVPVDLNNTFLKSK